MDKQCIICGDTADYIFQGLCALCRRDEQDLNE